jgi:hypothetical protein
MSSSDNCTHGRPRKRALVPWSRRWARAVLVPLVVAPVVGLAATSPATAVAEGAQSQSQSLSSAGPSFVVHGTIPYKPDSSADGTTPANTSCSTIRKLEALTEAKIAEYGVFPLDARNLLQHWLDGTGTQVSLGQNSGVARELLTYPGFVGMNNKIQAYTVQRLGQGQAAVTLPTPVSRLSPPTASSPLTLLDFSDEAHYPDLYWAFRGTQGLNVSGTGTENNGRYTGKLTYTIYDTYGFRANNTSSLSGKVAADMYYLQTHCGWPKYGAPRWFSDSLTVTVPFNWPAAS